MKEPVNKGNRKGIFVNIIKNNMKLNASKNSMNFRLIKAFQPILLTKPFILLYI